MSVPAALLKEFIFSLSGKAGTPAVDNRCCAAPNADTLYTEVWLDVAKEPGVCRTLIGGASRSCPDYRPSMPYVLPTMLIASTTPTDWASSPPAATGNTAMVPRHRAMVACLIASGISLQQRQVCEKVSYYWEL